jgi:hypothetical protein
MSEPTTNNKDGAQPTRAGCALAAISAAAMLGAAVPIVQWRDADTGQPLPRTVAIIAATSAGAICFGIGSALLRFCGLALWMESKKDEADRLEE